MWEGTFATNDILSRMSYAAGQQSVPFAALPPVAPQQVSGVTYWMRQPQPTKRPRPEGFFLITIVVCVLLLLGIGTYKLARVANTTSTPKQINTPSGNALIPSASSILKNAHTSSAIDNTLAPSHSTKTFIANQNVYVTFDITSGKQDGAIEAKWYADGLIIASTVLPHAHENTHGVFSNVYITATPDGAVELYWCTQSDCKDAQLAQVIHFVVNPIDTAYLQMYSEASTSQRHIIESFKIHPE
ncbi:MAG: hypothetical protein PVSMB2_14180 [Ktedonobacteraceae bacterium]